MMKQLSLVKLLLFFSLSIHAQNNNLPGIDKSPMDMSYYPSNYPVLKIQEKLSGPLMARIIYSRPQKAGRKIFGGLVKYGEVWRLGANEATEIDFYKNVKINNKKVSKGRYTLYAIPSETAWIIIFNKETDTWGSFKYNMKKDILRINVPVQHTETIAEYFSMYFEKTTTGFNLIVTWDQTKVQLPINF